MIAASPVVVSNTAVPTRLSCVLLAEGFVLGFQQNW